MTHTTPYQGLKVLEIAQGVAGPHAGLLLGLKGAEVTKIELPEGDWSRALGNACIGPEGLSPHFLAMNRGKRSVMLPLNKPEGQDIARRLAARADVLIESFRPGVMDRYGLGPARLMAENPRLIYASISGFGQTGPYAAKPAVDTILQAFTGMIAMNHAPGGPGHKIYITPIDMACGLYAALDIGAALYARDLKSAGGIHLDFSLMQTAAAMQAIKIMEAALTNGNPPLETFAPVGVVEAADGPMAIAAVRDEHFARIATALGLGHLPQDPRFADPATRMNNLPDLFAELNGVFRTKPKAQWAPLLDQEGIMHWPVVDYMAFLKDEHVRATGAFLNLDGHGAPVPVAAQPGAPRVAQGPHDPNGPWGRAPALGEHNAAVLAELGS